MSNAQEHPSRDELLAMAYADGELPPDERHAFEERMVDEPELRREVAELKKLELIARDAAPPEPMDHEWERIERGVVHRGGLGLGFFALLLGTVGLVGWMGYALWRCDLDLVPKVLVFVVLGGTLAVFLVVLRNRLRTLPYDPYTEIRR